MKTSRKKSRPVRVAGWALVALAWATLIWTGCSRQPALPGSGVATDNRKLPFDRVSEVSGVSPTAGFTSEAIPAGTEFIIRLQSGLSSLDSKAGDTFQGVLDESVVVAGRTVVPRGSTVSGSVVAVGASRYPHDPGYLRVTLASIVVNGKSVAPRTSSIFAKGGTYGKRDVLAINRSAADSTVAVGESTLASANGTEPLLHQPRISQSQFSSGHGDVRFSTGHRLSFRLTQPLHLEN